MYNRHSDLTRVSFGHPIVSFPDADNDQGRNFSDPFCPKLYGYESDTICKINFLLATSAIWIDSWSDIFEDIFYCFKKERECLLQ